MGGRRYVGGFLIIVCDPPSVSAPDMAAAQQEFDTFRGHTRLRCNIRKEEREPMAWAKELLRGKWSPWFPGPLKQLPRVLERS